MSTVKEKILAMLESASAIGHSIDADVARKIREWVTEWQIADRDLTILSEHFASKSWGAISDSFFQDLAFGTGGLRGIVGPGTNRMNEAGVARVAQGIASYMNAAPPAESRQVVIAYDSRLYSKAFAITCAEVLAGNKIKVFVFDEVETTPCLSFAVRELGCSIGLCLTASHNPPEYAGLKVYAKDGAQIVPPTDGQILASVSKITTQKMILSLPLDQARKEGLIQGVPAEVTLNYFAAVKKLETFPDRARSIRIAYTPLHGTGAKPAKEVMRSWRFLNFSIVPDQEKPDGHFPTVKKPNPEEPAALTRLIAHAQEIGADVGFATDPDSDRLAMVSRESAATRALFKDQCIGDYVLLNGNQTGALLLTFLLEEWKKQNRLPPGASVIKTIVTTELHNSICKKYGVHVFDTLTGFKWIAAKVREWSETAAPYTYIFGTEESFGYMPGSYVRDKDGIASLAITAEMADFFKATGRTACEQLLAIFKEYGCWKEDLHTINLEGRSGLERTEKIMNSLRTSPPADLAGHRVIAIEDYLSGSISRFSEQKTVTVENQAISLPKSDVLIFRMSDGSQISARPSGTEPKIKFYFSCVCRDASDTQAGYRAACEKIEAYKNSIVTFVSKIT
jgi:phosphoglucomutase